MSEQIIADVIILITVLANIYYAKVTHKKVERKVEDTSEKIEDVSTKVENGIKNG